MTTVARAYCNLGRWITGCPWPLCASAQELTPRQTEFYCGGVGGCGQRAPVEWPPDVEEIDAVLRLRPAPLNRNWFPAEHELALRSGRPHGQSAADLLAENDLHGVRGGR